MDVCSGGELAVALRAGFPAERIALHGNNKSTDELVAAVEAGVGRVVVDSFHEIVRLDAVARERGVVGAGDDQGDGRRRGAHPRVHRHRARRPEVRLLDLRRADDAAEAVRRVLKADALSLVGLHSHIGSQIFDTEGFEVAAHRVVRFLAQLHREHGAAALAALTTLDLGGGFGIAYRAQETPAGRPRAGRRAARHREARVPRR